MVTREPWRTLCSTHVEQCDARERDRVPEHQAHFRGVVKMDPRAVVLAHAGGPKRSLGASHDPAVDEQPDDEHHLQPEDPRAPERLYVRKEEQDTRNESDDESAK